MTKLITRTRYFLRGVWVRQDALGQVYSWVFADDVTVRLALPRSATDFNNSEEAQRLEPHWAHVRASAVSETEFAHAVYLVQVDAEFEDPINARQAKAAYQAERSSSDTKLWLIIETRWRSLGTRDMRPANMPSRRGLHMSG